MAEAAQSDVFEHPGSHDMAMNFAICCEMIEQQQTNLLTNVKHKGKYVGEPRTLYLQASVAF